MPNGVVKGYRLYYMKHNFTDVVTVRQTGSNVEYELHDLGEEGTRKEERMGDKIVGAVGMERERNRDPSGSLPSRATFCLNIGLAFGDQREKLKGPFAVKANITISVCPSGYY